MNIILGTAQLMHNYGLAKKRLKANDLKKILLYAKKNNCKYIDTAISYKKVNKILGKNNIKNFKIITKIKDLNNKNLVNKILFSKKELKISKFHAILLHDENELLNSHSKKNYIKLKELKKKGLTNHIGVSAYSFKKTLKIIQKFKIDLLQLPLNLFDRRFLNKKFLRIVKKNKIKIHFRSIFLQGLLLNQHLHKKNTFLKKSKSFKLFFGRVTATNNGVCQPVV